MTKLAQANDIIDRKTASRLLKISLRTLDRYRQSGQLSTVVIDNKIYLNRREIIEFKERQSRQKNKSYVSIDSREDREDTAEDRRDKTYEEVIHGRHEHDLNLSEYYKKMVEDFIAEIKEKQQQLEAAHYRIGQLEGQLRFSVPLLEYQQEKKQLLTEGSRYKKLAAEHESQAKKMQKNFLIERLNKRVYLAIVLILILLQPLWLLLVDR